MISSHYMRDRVSIRVLKYDTLMRTRSEPRSIRRPCYKGFVIFEAHTFDNIMKVCKQNIVYFK